MATADTVVDRQEYFRGGRGTSSVVNLCDKVGAGRLQTTSASTPMRCAGASERLRRSDHTRLDATEARRDGLALRSAQ